MFKIDSGLFRHMRNLVSQNNRDDLTPIIMKENLLNLIVNLFILLFLYTAISKILDHHEFRIQLGQSPLLSSFSDYAAWLVPAIELMVSLMLIFKRSRLAGLYASFALMTMFSAYIISITRFTGFIPCSCGGVLQNMSWNTHLIFNLSFITLGFIGILLYEPPRIHKPVVSNNL